MNILQLCKKFPYPLRDGESIAVTYLSKALKELGCDISLLAMNTRKHFVDTSSLPPDFDHYSHIYHTDLDTSVRPIDAFVNLFSSDSYHISRFVSKKFEEKLIEVLQAHDFDIVQMETLYLTPYMETIQKHSNAKIVLRAHNVEHEIWERITRNTSFLPQKMYLKYLTKKLKNFEIRHLHEYDMLVAITDRDLDNFRKLGYSNGAMVSPIGIDTSCYVTEATDPIEQSHEVLSICFIGSLDWMPNLEGITWFLDEPWRLIQQEIGDIELHIAGRNMPSKMEEVDRRNIHIHGEVADAVEFINSHPVMIVPLFSGSGMRVKILEGMALGKCVITTSMGLEGIGAKDQEQVLIANTAAEFVQALEFCKKNPARMREIGLNAKNYVERHYDNKEIAKELYKAYTNYFMQSKDVARQES